MEGKEILNYIEKYFYIMASREESFKVIDHFNEEINKKNKENSENMQNLFFVFFPFLGRVDFWGDLFIYSNLILKIKSYFYQLIFPYSNIISKITDTNFEEIINSQERDEFEFEWEIASPGDIPSIENYFETMKSSKNLEKEYHSFFHKNIKEYSIDIRKKIILIALKIINCKFIMEKIKNKMYGKHFLHQYPLPQKKSIGFKRCIHGKNKSFPCINCCIP